MIIHKFNDGSDRFGTQPFLIEYKMPHNINLHSET